MRKRAVTFATWENGEFDPFWRRRSGSVMRYAAAVMLIATALLITVALNDSLHATYFRTPLFFCAIVLSSWYGGFGPGICATLLSIFVLRFFFPDPHYAQQLSANDIPRFGVFLFAGGFISWLGDRQRRDEEALMHARDNLEEKVRARTAALTRANERLTEEIGERTRAEIELQRLNRAWRVRNACNLAVNRCGNEPDLLEQVCLAVVEVGGYRLAWVGYAEEGETKSIRLVARAGEAQRYLENFAVTWGDDERGLGPTGTAIRTGQPVVCNEISSDPHLAPWRASAEEHGLVSIVALPLAANGSAIGGLTVYSDEPDAFDKEETGLLQQAATDLTHGVVLLRAGVARQRAEEALKKTEEELGRVARVTAMGELAASIAHEVNQPLAAVVTNGNACLRWLSAEPPDFDEARTAAHRIVRDGNRASDVIARIRTFLKKGETVSRRLDANDMIREIVALTQSEVDRRAASLQTNLAANLPAVTGDRVQLQQVLLNLIINALDAMSAQTNRPRVIRIRTKVTESKSILIAVEDSGAGLDPRQAARLFDAFYTTKPEGLGMGLSISRSIVEAHGGRLWATPNEGSGATFQFTLPITEGAAA